MLFNEVPTENAHFTFSSLKNWSQEKWQEHGADRALFQGLPLSMVTAMIAGQIFSLCTLQTSLTFGASFYLSATLLQELFPEVKENNRVAYSVLFASSGIALAVTEIFMTVTLSWQATLLLTLSSLSGLLIKKMILENTVSWSKAWTT